MKIKIKLPLLFLLMVAVIGVTGLLGWKVIKGVTGISDLASDLIIGANKAYTEIQGARSTILEVLASTDEKEILERGKIVGEMDMKILKDLDLISEIVGNGNVELDFKGIRGAHQRFFELAPELISTRGKEAAMAAAVNLAREKFENQIMALDKDLEQFSSQNQAKMNAKENNAKTMLQAGKATVEKMNNLLSEFLNADYYLEKEAASLRGYLVNAQSTARAYLGETKFEKLQEMSKETEKFMALSNSALDKLVRRAGSTDKNIVDNFVKRSKDLNDALFSENGLFATYQAYLNTSFEVKLLKDLFAAEIDNYIAGINLINANIIGEARDIAERGESTAQKNIGIMIAIGVIIGVFSTWFIRRTIINPVNNVVNLASAIAKGDLSQRLKMASKDEIGHMAQALDGSCKNLSDMILQVKENAGTLAASSEEMSAVSTQLASAAEEMSTQSSSVAGTTEQMSAEINSMASAAEEMSVNIQNVSSTAEQMSQNMNAVAAAIEQMSATIKAVADRTQEGFDIAVEAAGMSASTTETMNALGGAAREIGQVTGLIKRIAEQTNLLALNATIEAASAGDAGKGFAVVANEIKELAKQSAQAAEDIARRIEGIQVSTEGAAKAIAAVADIVNKINASSLEISKSVQQQTVAATEISGNVQQAKTGVNHIASAMTEIARGANDVSHSAAETAKGVNEVSTNVQAVSQSVGDSASGIQQVNTSANELAQMAARIQEMVGRFKVAAV